MKEMGPAGYAEGVKSEPPRRELWDSAGNSWSRRQGDQSHWLTGPGATYPGRNGGLRMGSCSGRQKNPWALLFFDPHLTHLLLAVQTCLTINESGMTVGMMLTSPVHFWLLHPTGTQMRTLERATFKAQAVLNTCTNKSSLLLPVGCERPPYYQLLCPPTLTQTNTWSRQNYWLCLFSSCRCQKLTFLYEIQVHINLAWWEHLYICIYGGLSMTWKCI